jgi:archaellum biogenesis ATPase FlaH
MTNMLVSISPEIYVSRLNNVLREIQDAELKMLYVSLNKTYRSITRQMRSDGLEPNKIFFIDTITATVMNPEQTDNCLFLTGPDNLEYLHSQIIFHAKEKNVGMVVFDSLSSLTTYQNPDEIIHFVTKIIASLSGLKCSAIFTCLSTDENTKLVQHVKMMIDKFYQFKEKGSETEQPQFEGKERKKRQRVIEVGGFMGEYNSLFVSTSLANYLDVIRDIIEEIDTECIYLSYNKATDHIKKLLEKMNIDTSLIRFLSCVKGEGQENALNPESLTDVSYAIEKNLKEIGEKCFVIIDSVSSFTSYNQSSAISRFVTFFNMKMRQEKCGVVWLSISDESDDTFDQTVGSLCEKVIKITAMKRI